MSDGSINNDDCKQQVQSKADEVLSGLAAKKKLLETRECVRLTCVKKPTCMTPTCMTPTWREPSWGEPYFAIPACPMAQSTMMTAEKNPDSKSVLVQSLSLCRS
jgi:hypothetical protein